MIELKCRLIARGWVPGQSYTRSEFNAAKKEAFADAARFYFQNIRPKHFERPAVQEYGYAPRQGDPGNPGPKGFKKSYVARKIAKFGHNRPLVFSGSSLAATRMATIRPTSKGAQISVPVGYLNFKPKNFKGDMGQEFKSFSQADIRDIEQIIARSLLGRLKRCQQTRTEDIGTGGKTPTAYFHGD